MTLGYLYPSVHHPHHHHHPPRPHLPRRSLRRLLNLGRTRPRYLHLGLTQGLFSHRFRRRLMLLRRPNVHVCKKKNVIRLGKDGDSSGARTGSIGSACLFHNYRDQL